MIVGSEPTFGSVLLANSRRDPVCAVKFAMKPQASRPANRLLNFAGRSTPGGG
jgi:hypothetical protein